MKEQPFIQTIIELDKNQFLEEVAIALRRWTVISLDASANLERIDDALAVIARANFDSRPVKFLKDESIGKFTVQIGDKINISFKVPGDERKTSKNRTGG